MMETRYEKPSGGGPESGEARAHHAECLCAQCEANGGGAFAQRAFLKGDLTAARHLGPEVCQFLYGERAGKKTLRARAESPRCRR